MANIKKRATLPLIPVRGLVVFPYMILHFDVARKKSIAALEMAMAGEQLVFLTAQKDVTVENPTAESFYQIGTVSKVKQLLKLPNNNVRVLVEGLYRAKIDMVTAIEPCFQCDCTEVRSSAKNITPLDEEASRRIIQEMLDEFLSVNPNMSPDTLKSIAGIDDLGQYADMVAGNFISTVEDKQTVLAEPDVMERLTSLAEILSRETEVLKAERDILLKVRSNIDQHQREYFLREQIKVINRELDGDEADEVDEYRELIEKANLPEEALKKANKELSRLAKSAPNSPEGAVIRNYLDCLLELPFGIKTPENKSIKNAEKILNADHFGMKKVKERILEYLAVRNLTGGIGGQILCLVGPPGVGKTSIARSIAEALGRKYVRVSLGGVRDEAEIRGHRKTYIGAMPGRIINAVRLAGSSNALVLLDEVDKLGSDYKGDPASALLEVLDSEQNFAFRDHYIEIPFDLSDIMFLTTANNAENIPRPLLDRMEIIDLSGYTSEEKIQIATRHLVPKNMKKHGLSAESFKIQRSAIADVIDYYTREAGVRNLERELATVCRRAAKALVSGAEAVEVTPRNLEDYLGTKKYRRETLSYIEDTGIVRGLAWTPVGGDTLSIEVNIMDGSGKIELTGNLGDVMKESARAAISFIRTRANALNIDPEFYSKKDIHLHVPEGAVPKDGPSAGITIATAIISALTGRAVRGDIAMTGEVTIRGRVLPVGGITEKVLAAYRYGVKTVILPSDNQKDLNEIPQNVKKKLTFVPVSSMDEVIKNALSPSAINVEHPAFIPPVTGASHGERYEHS